MFLKLKPVVLFVSILGISCFAINFLGFNSSLFAEEDKSSTKKEISSETSEHPACKATSECDIKEAKADHHKKKCAGKSDYNTPCGKQSKCGKGDKGGGHCVDDMIRMVHCEKKKLLKEKIRARLEAKIGAKLDKVADLLVDSMLEDYKADGDNKESREKLKEQLCQIFSEEKSK